MNETAIKAIVLGHFIAERKLCSGTLVANEFAVDDHARRADLAFFAEAFVCVEVKSSLDTLRRLPSQIEAYQRYFDEVVIVVAERHIAGALKVAPSTAVIKSVVDGELVEVRGACHQVEIQTERLAELLHAHELRRLLELKGGRFNRRTLLEMTRDLPQAGVRAAVLQSLERRFRLTSDRFWSGLNSTFVTETDLKNLSRFEDRRQAMNENAVAASAFWTNWQSKANEAFG